MVTALSLGNYANKLEKLNAINSISNANNKNRLKILIPTHRISQLGNPNTTFEKGIWRKQWLQDFEKRNLQT